MIATYHTPPFPERFVKIHRALKDKGVLGEYGRRVAFTDEPHFFKYFCDVDPRISSTKKVLGLGCSEDEGQAFVAAVAEAIEQYCVVLERDDLFIRNSFEKLTDHAINPLRFVPFSSDQLTLSKYKQFRVTEKTQLNWLEGYSLTRNKNVLVPASIVYSNYNSKARNEPVILFKNSTGAACGPTREYAIYRGLCEVIERDAYMNSFIGNLPLKIIDVHNNPDLSRFIRRVERYDFKVYCLDTSIDCPVFTTTCILLDKTGSGPAVCIGLGGSMSPEQAIKAAVFEAIRRHISIRSWFFRPKPRPIPSGSTLEWHLIKKQYVWSAPHMIHAARKYLKGQKITYEKLLQGKKTIIPKFAMDKERVHHLVDVLKRLKCEVLCVDVTAPEVRELGLSVVKILVPEMVPLWHDGRYPYLGTNRLFDMPEKYKLLKTLGIRTNEYTTHPF